MNSLKYFIRQSLVFLVLSYSNNTTCLHYATSAWLYLSVKSTTLAQLNLQQTVHLFTFKPFKARGPWKCKKPRIVFHLWNCADRGWRELTGVCGIGIWCNTAASRCHVVGLDSHFSPPNWNALLQVLPIKVSFDVGLEYFFFCLFEKILPCTVCHENV